MAGTIVADDIQHSTAGSVGTEYVVQGSAKLWFVYDNTSTNELEDSLNVSSMTDNGGGQMIYNFSSSMSSANYSTVFTGDDVNYGSKPFNRGAEYGGTRTSSAGEAHLIAGANNNRTDSGLNCGVVFGDLA